MLLGDPERIKDKTQEFSFYDQLNSSNLTSSYGYIQDTTPPMHMGTWPSKLPQDAASSMSNELQIDLIWPLQKATAKMAGKSRRRRLLFM
jgi:hypothetical protein